MEEKKTEETKKEMKLPLVTDLNGRIYPPEILEAMKNKINTDRGVSGQFPPSPDGKIYMSNMAFNVLPTAEVANNVLEVDIEVLPTPAGKLLSQFMYTNNYILTPHGIGTVKDGVVQEDYQLISVSIVEKREPLAETINEAVVTYLPNVRATGEFVDAMMAIAKKVAEEAGPVPPLEKHP